MQIILVWIMRSDGTTIGAKNSPATRVRVMSTRLVDFSFKSCFSDLLMDGVFAIVLDWVFVLEVK